MFDIGFTELVLVAVIGLLILGPERMPVAVRTIGLWVGKIKRTVSGVQKEIQDELRVDEIRKKADENRKAIEDRMAELQAETDIMEAPVVAAQDNQPAKKPVKKVAAKNRTGHAEIPSLIFPWTLTETPPITVTHKPQMVTQTERVSNSLGRNSPAWSPFGSDRK